MNITECFNQIDSCEFECEGGPLRLNVGYIGLKSNIAELEQQLAELREAVRSGEASDGYHTHNELYEFRKLYNATLFNEWAKSGKYHVHKSLRHHDGDECFGGGWFIVVAQLPAGQITNHYKLDCWDMFRVQETEKALFEYDGHTGADTIDRLKQLLQESEK